MPVWVGVLVWVVPSVVGVVCMVVWMVPVLNESFDVKGSVEELHPKYDLDKQFLLEHSLNLISLGLLGSAAVIAWRPS